MGDADCGVVAGSGVCLIVVKPYLHVWAVESPEVQNALLYPERTMAEAAAQVMGQRLAAAGRWVEIRVVQTGGAVGVRFICPPLALTKDPGEG